MDTSDWREHRVVGIGIVGLDHVAVTDRWERDGKSTASHYFEQVGGPVPVALMAMARLGMNTAPLFAGVIGEDDVGRIVRRELSEELDVTLLVSYLRASTPRSLVVLSGSDGSRALTNWNDGSLPTLSREQTSGLRGCGLLHIDGRDAQAITEAIHVLRESGTMVSLDLGSFREEKRPLLSCCDIVIASKVGGAVAGVTLGADGVVIGCRDEGGDEPVHLPAFPVENVPDTCGAGDCFHGAFLWAYRERKSAIEAATFAQAAVALRIQHYGNRAGLPTRDAVEAFLAGHR